EQRYAEHALQVADARRHVRLNGAELARGAREPLGLVNRDKKSQVLHVHPASCYLFFSSDCRLKLRRRRPDSHTTKVLTLWWCSPMAGGRVQTRRARPGTPCGGEIVKTISHAVAVLV